jgi:D-alanyl-D-alanine carboxypeptidase
MISRLFSAWLGLLCIAAASPAPTEFDVPAIDAYLEEQVKQSGIVGMSVALVRDGKAVLVKGYGHRSLEPRQPVTTNTLFAIGSVTKQFACACILLLAEDGKLSVQDKVAKYYPGLTRADEITLLDLMQHVSGYPDFYPLDFLDRRMQSPIAVDELIRQYAGGKLDFEPGARYSYSNTGFMILGRVVEKVSGRSFSQFLQERLLNPAEMTQTVFERGQSRHPVAHGYTSFALSPPDAAPPEADGWIFSAGAMYSSALDLAKWDLALIDGKLLQPGSFQTMTTPRKLAGGKLTTYGCGLGVSLRNGFLVLAHNGAVNGFGARNATVPATRSAVVMLCNLDAGGAFARMHNHLLSLLVKTPSNVPSIAGPPAADVAQSFVRRLQQGKLDRTQLGDEFAVFLNEEKLRGAAQRLKALGNLKLVEVEDQYERGGMEVSNLRIVFPRDNLKGLMYRSTDGKIQEFFVDKP